MGLFVVGVNHRTATLPIRERLYVSESRIPELLQTLLHRGYLEEGIVLSTCNRFELYGFTTTPHGSLIGLERFLSERTGYSFEDFEKCWYAYEAKEAVRHLFRVTSGLDSMIVGESEIQGQVKSAYEKAKEAGFTGTVMHRLFEKALNAAKSVREKTGISHGKISVGSYAVEVAQKIFGETLSEKKLLVIGAGEVGKMVSLRFSALGATLFVTSRTYDNAQKLAAKIQGRAISFDAIPDLLSECDIVVSAAKCPRFLIHAKTVESALRIRRGKPIFLLDLSVPRNIDPSIHRLPYTYLYHLDDLEKMVALGLNVRSADLKQCEEILGGKVAYFTAWLDAIPRENMWQGSPVPRSLPVS